MTTKKKKSNLLIWILLALVVIAVVAAMLSGKGKKSGIPVELEKVKKRTLVESVSASGKIYPETEVKISSDVSGEIVALFVQEGDSIQVGQTLLRIDPEAYVSSVERGQASLKTTQAQAAMAKSSLESSKAQKAQINAQLINAKDILKRNEALYKEGVLSELELNASKSNVQALEANLRAAVASIRSSEQNIEAANFNIEGMAASLKELKTNLHRTTIKSPTDGVVSMLNVEEGERVVGTIQMAGTDIMRISNLNSMEVVVEVSENDILRVEVGDEVKIEIDAYLDRDFKGEVTEVANSASNAGMSSAISSGQVTNFIVKIRIDPSSYKDLISNERPFPLRPGMSAGVDIYTEKVQGAISVPIQSVTTRVKESKNEDGTEEDLEEVVFVKRNDTVAMIPVTTGIQDDDNISILSGLSEEDEVVVGPYRAISKTLQSGKEITKKEKKKKKKD